MNTGLVKHGFSVSFLSPEEMTEYQVCQALYAATRVGIADVLVTLDELSRIDATICWSCGKTIHAVKERGYRFCGHCGARINTESV